MPVFLLRRFATFVLTLLVASAVVFAVQLQWVGAGGFPGWTEAEGGGPWEGLKALLLPALALALVQLTPPDSPVRWLLASGARCR